MSKQLQEAVEFLTKSYGDIKAQASSYTQQLNPKDVQSALAKADTTSVEYVVLLLLAQHLSDKAVEIKDSKGTVTVDANSTEVE
jgi:hypothetical protein